MMMMMRGLYCLFDNELKIQYDEFAYLDESGGLTK